MKKTLLKPSNQLIACHECDMLLKIKQPPPGQKAYCPRCGYILQRGQRNSVRNGIALSLAGLMLWLPASFLPIMSLNLYGNIQSENLYSGVLALTNGGYWALAALVFLCSMAIPLTKLLLLLYTLIQAQKPNRSLPGLQCFRWYHAIDSWGMLEVYMLGILVSVIKLIDLAEVTPGIGLLCFIFLMICSTAMSSSIDKHEIWDMLDKETQA